MKIAVLGLDFPLGKKNLPDERLDKLNTIFHPPKVTPIQIEFQDSTHLKDADALLCEENKKLDLILMDLEIAEQRISEDDAYKGLFTRIKEALEKETLLCEIPFSEEEQKSLSNFNLTTLKPATFIKSQSIDSLPEIIKSSYKNSGRISFFTVNEKELRAWSIKKETTCYEAAGLIHSDIQRGFIKAEVAGCEDLIKSGGLNQARGKGLVRLEDKDYLVKDGDLIQFRFNV